mgnify:CR=1 FL=1
MVGAELRRFCEKSGKCRITHKEWSCYGLSSCVILMHQGLLCQNIMFLLHLECLRISVGRGRAEIVNFAAKNRLV